MNSLEKTNKVDRIAGIEKMAMQNCRISFIFSIQVLQWQQLQIKNGCSLLPRGVRDHPQNSIDPEISLIESNVIALLIRPLD